MTALSHAARHYELAIGEIVAGEVVRLPHPGAHHGNALILQREGDLLAIPATAKRGHTVLERELRRLRVRVGDRVRIAFHGKRSNSDGAREYRMYRVEVIA